MKQTKNKKRKQEFYMRHKVETVKALIVMAQFSSGTAC